MGLLWLHYHFLFAKFAFSFFLFPLLPFPFSYPFSPFHLFWSTFPSFLPPSLYCFCLLSLLLSDSVYLFFAYSSQLIGISMPKDCSKWYIKMCIYLEILFPFLFLYILISPHLQISYYREVPGFGLTDKSNPKLKKIGRKSWRKYSASYSCLHKKNRQEKRHCSVRY